MCGLLNKPPEQKFEWWLFLLESQKKKKTEKGKKKRKKRKEKPSPFYLEDARTYRHQATFLC